MLTVNGIRQKQSLPLEAKEIMAEERIRQWITFTDNNMYVAYSGGKDSTVLGHLVRRISPSTPFVFTNTGLEFPEIVKFVRQQKNVIWLRPKMRYKDVIQKYGYPVISKVQALYIHQIRETKSEKLRNYRLNGFPNGPTGKISEKWKYLLDAPFKISEKCCEVMKEAPRRRFEKESGLLPIVGIMASDGKNRENLIMRGGCNAYGAKNPSSRPLAMWTEADIWQYIKKYDVPYSPIYDMGYTRTGCMFCLFGLHLEMRHGEHRFERMRRTHPKLHDYCMNTLGLKEVMKWYPERNYHEQERIVW